MLQSIKTYLKNTMIQGRLKTLTVLSIHNFWYTRLQSPSYLTLRFKKRNRSVLNICSSSRRPSPLPHDFLLVRRCTISFTRPPLSTRTKRYAAQLLASQALSIGNTIFFFDLIRSYARSAELTWFQDQWKSTIACYFSLLLNFKYMSSNKFFRVVCCLTLRFQIKVWDINCTIVYG